MLRQNTHCLCRIFVVLKTFVGVNMFGDLKVRNLLCVRTIIQSIYIYIYIYIYIRVYIQSINTET